jgi:hypothetical protein
MEENATILLEIICKVSSKQSEWETFKNSMTVFERMGKK